MYIMGCPLEGYSIERYFLTPRSSMLLFIDVFVEESNVSSFVTEGLVDFEVEEDSSILVSQ